MNTFRSAARGIGIDSYTIEDLIDELIAAFDPYDANNTTISTLDT